MPLADTIRELNDELGRFVWRGRMLPADVVLLGLSTDVLETAAAIQETADSDFPHKAFANARLAFETAQHLLALATHEHYEQAGAEAWAYFELKTASWKSAALRLRDPATTTTTTRDLLEARVEQMRGVLTVFRPDAPALLDQAVAVVWDWHKRNGRPDNWVPEKMTSRQRRAYEMFAAATAGRVPADTSATNEAMYKVLCHETHAHPRLKQFEIRVDGRGVQFIRRLRDADGARRSVTGATELAVMESINALRWQRTGTV
jgi:hypothetical protein